MDFSSKGSALPFLLISVGLFLIHGYEGNFDPDPIKDKRVLITGTSSEIGEHVAYEYCRLGARVFITGGRGQQLLQEVADKCKELGAKQVEFLAAELEEETERIRVITEVKKRFGGLDQMILSHAKTSDGLWLGSKENLTMLRRDLNVGFISFVDLTSQALGMLSESKGSVGVVSSISGKVASAGLTSTAASNHAMLGFFSGLRQELLLRDIGVSVTTCVVGPMDVQEDNKKRGIIDSLLNTIFGETYEGAAIAIVRGVNKRSYEIHYGLTTYLFMGIHKIIPGSLEDYCGKLFIERHKNIK